MAERFSDNVRYRHIQALTAFRMYWRESDEYPEENEWNDYVVMPVIIRYERLRGKPVETFASTIRASIHPGDDGNI